jgi:hypothetical protein
VRAVLYEAALPLTPRALPTSMAAVAHRGASSPSFRGTPANAGRFPRRTRPTAPSRLSGQRTLRNYERRLGLPIDLEHSRTTGRRAMRPRGCRDRHWRDPPAECTGVALPQQLGRSHRPQVGPMHVRWAACAIIREDASSRQCTRRRRAGRTMFLTNTIVPSPPQVRGAGG